MATDVQFVLGDDESELDRYKAVTDNQANQAQYLAVDAPDDATVGYFTRPTPSLAASAVRAAVPAASGRSRGR
ncbi:hypothetical protein [Streptomyces sp. NPDC056682]|uniref:hypothetical protein n=1 Tax=Streptomyces sp. NPDC056682 TaxID=3345909 RepID=UPI0036B5EEBE